MIYLGVLGVTFAGLLVAGLGDWRTGIRIVSGALVGAATLRLVLPEREAGMLAVRHRMLDVSILVVIAGALLLLASTIPEQPV